MVPALFLLLAASSFEDSFRAGLLALQRGDLGEAESNLERASGFQPSNGRVWVALAQLYSKEGRPTDANAAVVKARSLSSADPVVDQTLGVYYQELLREGKYSDAITLLQPFDDAQSRLALGVAYYALRRFDDAAAAFLRVIELSPEVQQAYLFLGKFLDQIPGRLPEVSKAFASYAAKHPEDWAASFLLARVQLQNGRPEDAEKLLRQSLALNDREAAVHFDLGTVLDGRRLFAEAASEYRKAATIDPSDAAAHYRLSRDYDRLGKTELAREEREIHARLTRAQDAVR